MINRIYYEDLVIDEEDSSLIIDSYAIIGLYESLTYVLDKVKYNTNRENFSLKDKIVFDNLSDLRLALQESARFRI